jgi:enoyl-CoA hydratase/carnithine racemase
MTEHVRIEQDGGVLAITLTRPERRNAITTAMYAAMAKAIRGAATDDNVRLISLRGEGEDLTAGNDLGDFLATPSSNREDHDSPAQRLLQALAMNEVPIIVAVQGNAVGIGTTMLFHCDLVVAEDGCRFIMPFVDLGLVPEAASTLLMPRLAGRRAAARHLLLAEPFGALEALEMGLVSHVAAQGTLNERFDQILQSLLRKPREALRLTQSLLRQHDREQVLTQMAVEHDHFAERLASDEVKQAIARFFASRSDRATS